MVEDCNQMTYTTAKLPDVCSLISSGGTPSRKRPEYFCDSEKGHLWVKSKELLDGSISMTEENITDEAIENSSAKYYPANTILLAMYGANVGQLGWLKQKATINQAICGMVVDEDVAHWRYIFYAIMAKRRELVAKAFGAAQQNLNQEIIQTFEIPLSPLSTQRKIASILSAYDDLIENNTRRIKILEEMAQTIYREWFVNFRFPDHEKVKMVESELGIIPEGWEVKKLGDVLETLESGSRPKGGIDATVREIPSVGAENVLGLGKYDYSKEKFVTREFYERMNKGHIQSGDVLLYKDGAKLGRKSMFMDGFPHQECCINEHAFILRSNELCSQAYLYFWLDLPNVTQDIINLNANAAQPGINQGSVKSLSILLADERVRKRFDEIVYPILKEIFNLSKKKANLRQTRDLLLPKLISGELDVSELDIETGKKNT